MNVIADTAHIAIAAEGRLAAMTLKAFKAAIADARLPLAAQPLRVSLIAPEKSICASIRQPPSLELSFAENSAAPSFHSAWTSCKATQTGRWAIPSPPSIAILEILRVLPEIRRASAVLLRPASALLEEGPVDSIRFGGGSRHMLPAELDGIELTLHTLVVPHTRCWVISLSLELAERFDIASVTARLQESDRIVIAPAALGFRDTAAITEFFRDLVRLVPGFPEIVCLAPELFSDNNVHMWVAVDEASQVAQALDCAMVHFCDASIRHLARKFTAEVLSVVPRSGLNPGSAK